MLLYINGVLGKESHSLPIDYNYVIRASETMIIDWQCIAFPIPFRKVINLWPTQPHIVLYMYKLTCRVVECICVWYTCRSDYVHDV